MTQTEQELFDELGSLCISPGYVHAFAFICFKDNVVGYVGKLTADDLLKKYSWDKLIRTELTTLLGLIIKAPIDYRLPSPDVTQRYIDETYRLLTALHKEMSNTFLATLTHENLQNRSFDPFDSANVLREPIFYSSESAYAFQLRDLAVKKYSNDNAWLSEHKGFSIDTTRDVVSAVGRTQNAKVTDTVWHLRSKHPFEWSLLPGFWVTVDEVARESGHDQAMVRNVLRAFSLPANECNTSFRSLHDFNAAIATPLLPKQEDTFILFEQYTLAQALYDSPFYWMGADPDYASTAMEHRGRFTEAFVTDRLERVFGKERVFRDVKVFESKGKQITDIDVLVEFGDRALIVQAKSKRLTLEARRGNDGQLKADFKKAVQDAYDQGYAAASAFTHSGCKCLDKTGSSLRLPARIREVFILCVVSDFYPALAFQAKQFLKYRRTQVIHPPMVADVFAVDAITEMLEEPLWFLSYIHRRTSYTDKLYVPDELTALSYHLKRNLWLEDKYDIVQLHDDLACDLDAAMTVRREGLPGERTPEGILTKFRGTTLERMLKEVQARPAGAALDFAFTVLTFDEQACKKLSDGIDKVAERANRDRLAHDVTIGVNSAPHTGVTVHCSDYPDVMARQELIEHCEKRKYIHKAQKWFGVCIRPIDKKIRFGIELNFAWSRSAAMDAKTAAMSQGPCEGKGKIGRNDPCPCGSGKKYKKCCAASEGAHTG